MIVNNIIAIINEKYFDKNLCLNCIADTLMMSSIYIGRIFKDIQGKSVAEYIHFFLGFRENDMFFIYFFQN